MTFKKRILTRAEFELREIFCWIEERSPEGAGRWLAAFDEAVESALRNPHSLPLAPEDEFVEFEARHFIFKTRRGRKYRAIFTIVDDELRIMHIRGSGQNVMDEPGPPNDD